MKMNFGAAREMPKGSFLALLSPVLDNMIETVANSSNNILTATLGAW